MTNDYDLVVLGGGTGGYVAAIRASQLGLKTAVVEHQKVGGTCLHRGCIPSKVLLKSAEKWRDLQQIESFGLKATGIDFDFSKIQDRKHHTIHTLYQGVQSLLKKAKVDVFEGYGRILGSSIFSPIPGTISIDAGNGEENKMLVPKNVLIATGSRPRALPSLSFDGDKVLHSDDALDMEQLPASMIIIGGGVIGIEWASLLIDYGVEVTVLEQAETILPGEDAIVQQEIHKQLSKRGVIIKTSCDIDTDNIHKTNEAITIPLKDKTTITAEKTLVSIGRAANTEEIGLANTDIHTSNGFIETNDMYQTNETHIYAIGDCIGGMQLAHSATKEGIIAVEHIANQQPTALDQQYIPSCIYSYPEAAKIGLTEKAAIEAGHEVEVGMMPFQAIGKTQINGQAEGYMKIITDKVTADILGIHLVGDQATELIAEASLAKLLDATAWEISQTIHPHPTVSEIFGEAALAVKNEQIHG